MSKISTYANASPVTLSDLLIGTSVGATPANATKNFLVSDLLALSDTFVSLQEVLDVGNTAIQNLTLTGDLGVTGDITHSGAYGYSNGQFTMAATGSMVLGGALTCNSSVSLTGTVKDYNDTLGTDGKVLMSDGSSQVTWQSAAFSPVSIITKSADYTLSSLNEAGAAFVYSGALLQGLIIPLNATVAFPIGTKIDVLQEGAGQVQAQGVVGVTLNSAGSKDKTFVQYSVAHFIKTATDTWYFYGDISA